MLATKHSASPLPQPQLFNKLTDIIPNIQFACFVRGEKLMASITHAEDTGAEKFYRISFSDGHKGAYKPLIAGVRRSGNNVLDAYAMSIQDDLCVVHTLREEDRQVLLHFRVDHECGHTMNVWIEQRADTYRVYFSGEYQFHLRKREEWEVRTSRNDRDYIIDRGLASLIEQQLERRGFS